MPKKIDERRLSLILSHIRREKKSYITKISKSTGIPSGSVYYYLRGPLKEKVRRIEDGGRDFWVLR